jgi:ligand-binding sensor domain-containing protein
MRKLLLLSVIFASCSGTPADQTKNAADTTANKDTAAIQQRNDPGISSPVMLTDKPVYAILQDRAGAFWFATNGDGVFRYDGKAYAHFTVKNGLCNDFVRGIAEDKNGQVWFATGSGLCTWDGKQFATVNSDATGSSITDKSGNTWFCGKGGAFRYDGKTLDFVALPMVGADIALRKTKPDFNLFPYEVYCMLEDGSGNIWFGTAARGLCRYDGKNYRYFTDNGLGRAAIRCMVQDNAGNLWFGNNGMGLYRYDGKTFTNFTAEQGLSNVDFLNTSHVTDKPGTLARVFAAAKDNSGNLWFGTIDAGAWRWDGHALVNYTMKDGLQSKAVHTIYTDQSGNLLFGGDSGRVFRFNGNRFDDFPGQGMHR